MAGKRSPAHETGSASRREHAYASGENPHWIQGAVKHPGAFTEKAREHGESVQEYAQEVTAPGSHADATTKRQGNLAKTFERMSHHH
ncbi:MAG: hypothetical protein ACLQBD_18365 [Syntrophobacteraceae bacterium]